MGGTNNKTKNIPQLKLIKSINAHKNYITSISIFPSGNIISVSYDKSIKIYDINFNIIQNIKNAHNNSIFYVDIKDEDNFVTSSFDKSIKIWIKNKSKNKFELKEYINNAHNDLIYKVIYFTNNKLISCSLDGCVKIWEEENENNYQLITSLKHFNCVFSILLIKDRNILISSGNDGTKLWNLNNFELIKYFKEAVCCRWNHLIKINENQFIVGDYKIIRIISLIKKRIIKEIKIPYINWEIKIINEKGIFLFGIYRDIIIFRNENYKFIQSIKYAHEDNINGFIELKQDLICSYSNDGSIKIWSF